MREVFDAERAIEALTAAGWTRVRFGLLWRSPKTGKWHIGPARAHQVMLAEWADEMGRTAAVKRMRAKMRQIEEKLYDLEKQP